MKLKINWGGLCLSSVFGAIFALFSVNIKVDGVLVVLIKIFVSVCMSYMLNFSLKKLLKKAVFLFLYTFLFGGMIFALLHFFGISTQNGLAFQYNFNFPIGGVCALCIFLFVGMCFFIKKMWSKKKIGSFLYDITLCINNKKVCLNGFLDTGNTLESRSGKPVVMIPQKILNRFFNAHEMLSFVLNRFGSLPIKNPQTISVSSVSGKTDVLVFEAEKCLFNQKEVDICVGVYDDKMFQNKEFDAILNQKMLEVWKCLVY